MSMDALQPRLDAMPGPMVPAAFEVTAKRQDTEDVWTLELVACSGEPFPFEPGQFTMLASRGAGEVPISISGDPDEPERLVHTIRAVGMATEAICDAEVGEVLSVRGPFGTPWPLDAAEGSDVLDRRRRHRSPAAARCDPADARAPRALRTSDAALRRTVPG